MNCSVEGCERPSLARGWCSTHYQRWQKHGDPLKGPVRGKRPRFQPGDRAGRLTVVEEVSRPSGGIRWYRCVCECGTEIVVRGASLGRQTNSCGCLRREKTGARARARTTHGHTVGGKQTPTFNSWASMRDRCYLKSAAAYPNYGGRGITVYDRWRDSFEAFLADMGERPPGKTLDRINPLGNYEPGNCQWSTPREQARNRRKTDEIIALIDRYERALLAIRNGVDDPRAVAEMALDAT